jgi:hypothetical protein
MNSLIERLPVGRKAQLVTEGCPTMPAPKIEDAWIVNKT